MKCREVPLFNAENKPERPNEGRMHPTPEQLLIREAVKRLTIKQTVVWEYYSYDRFTQDEIAKKLGITQQGVAHHIKRIEARITKWVASNAGTYALLKQDYSEVM